MPKEDRSQLISIIENDIREHEEIRMSMDEDAKKSIDKYVTEKEAELKGETGNVYFAAFKVVNGRLMMYSDPEIDKVRFMRVGSRLLYRLNF